MYYREKVLILYKNDFQPLTLWNWIKESDFYSLKISTHDP